MGDAEVHTDKLRQLTGSQSGLYINGIRAVRQVEELCFMILIPCTPFTVIQFIAVEHLANHRRIVESKGETKVSVVASQLKECLGHLAETAPQNAVATEYDRAEKQSGLLLQRSILLLGVDNGDAFFASYPHLATMNIQGTYRHIAEGE